MNVFEIIGGVVMVLLCVAIALLVLMQEGTKGGGIAALTGSNDSFFGKNPGRTRDAMLYKATRFCAIVFFVVTILVHALNVYMA